MKCVCVCVCVCVCACACVFVYACVHECVCVGGGAAGDRQFSSPAGGPQRCGVLEDAANREIPGYPSLQLFDCSTQNKEMIFKRKRKCERDVSQRQLFSGWKAVIETNLTGTFLCCREGESPPRLFFLTSFSPTTVSLNLVFDFVTLRKFGKPNPLSGGWEGPVRQYCYLSNLH